MTDRQFVIKMYPTAKMTKYVNKLTKKLTYYIQSGGTDSFVIGSGFISKEAWGRAKMKAFRK